MVLIAGPNQDRGTCSASIDCTWRGLKEPARQAVRCRAWPPPQTRQRPTRSPDHQEPVTDLGARARSGVARVLRADLLAELRPARAAGRFARETKMAVRVSPANSAEARVTVLRSLPAGYFSRGQPSRGQLQMPTHAPGKSASLRASFERGDLKCFHQSGYFNQRSRQGRRRLSGQQVGRRAGHLSQGIAEGRPSRRSGPD